MKLSSAPEAIINALQNCIKRFPVAVAFITALTLFLIFLIIDEEKTLSGHAIGTTIYYLSVGYLLSLTLRLWAEDGRKERTVMVVNIVAHLLLLADTLYIYYSTADEHKTNWELYVAHAATILSLWLSLFFLPFFRERNNVASWNFTMRLILNSIICYFIGNVLAGGFVLLLTSFNFLFNIELGYRWMLIAETLIGMLLPTLLFLGRIPQGEQKFDRKPLDSNFLNAVIRYLFLALEGLYIIVLYIYAALILFRWELPNGQVSMLVVVSMAGLIIIEFGLYPARKLQNKRTDNFIARYLPVAILPLLLLMTVGIIGRFSDYGVTISRLYLITLNLWFYFVCITLFLTKARRINWITISFALIFLLTSAFPINFFSITRNYMDSKIRQTLYTTDGIRIRKFPLNEGQYKHLLHILTKEEAVQLNDKMRYMRQHFGSHYTDAYVKDSTEVYFYYDFLIENYVPTVDEFFNSCPDRYAFDIPEGYNRMVHVFTPVATCKTWQEGVKVIPTNGEERFDTVYISVKTLKEHEQVMDTPILLPCSSDSTRYYATRFHVTDNRKGEYRIDVTGFVLQKK